MAIRRHRRRHIKRKGLALVWHSLLIYFAHPYLSVSGGLGLTFLFWPPSRYSVAYRALLLAVDRHLLGIFFLSTSLSALAVVMRVGPEKCGMELPCIDCMSRQEAIAYLMVFLLQWGSLSLLGLYFWNSMAKTGGSTYWLIGFALGIRASVVIAHLLRHRNEPPACQ